MSNAEIRTTEVSTRESPPVGIGRYRWRIAALLFLATTLNHVDRQVIGILTPDLRVSMGWSDRDYSFMVIIFAMFSFIYLLAWLILKIGIPYIRPVDL